MFINHSVDFYTSSSSFILFFFFIDESHILESDKLSINFSSFSLKQKNGKMVIKIIVF